MSKRNPVTIIRSRKAKNGLISAFFAFIGFLAFIDRVALQDVRSAIRTAIWASDDRKQFHQKSFLVVAVIDGDTLDIVLPGQPDKPQRVRLLGVDTPETKNPVTGVMYYGPQAETVTRQLAEGKKIYLRLDRSNNERDRYHRLLAYVILPDGTVLNERLIAEGYGYADLRFPHSQYEKYLQLMQTAMAEKRGLWQQVQPNQLPKWLIEQKPDMKGQLKTPLR